MKKNKLLTILMVVFTLLPFLTFSQNQTDEFISLRQENSMRISDPDVNKINAIKRNKLYKSVQLITLGNLPKIVNANNGSLPIQLPGTRKTYLVKEDKFVYESDLDYEWTGKISGRDVGEILIVCTEGRIAGQVFINEEAFVIQSFNKETSVLIEYNDKELESTNLKCGTKNPKVSEDSKDEMPINTSRPQVKIKVLVFYTPAAVSAGDMTSISTLAVSQMNQAFSNSGIAGNAAVELASSSPLSFPFTETGNIDNDLAAFRTNPNIQAYRDAYLADVVVLLTGNSYGTVYGMAATVVPDNANSYAIVEAGAATSNRYTFAHEIGHLLGCRHNDDTTWDPISYNHGHTFWTGSFFKKQWRYTMMAVTPSGYPRILHYSNPDVSYLSKPTGTTDYNNNALRIIYTSGTVSCFRDCLPPFYVTISGPAKGYNDGTYTWTSNLSGGTGPYTYNWEYTFDGVNYSSIGNTSSITNQLPYNDDLDLRLTVVSGIGQVGVDYHYTMNMGDNPHGVQSDLNNVLKKSDSESIVSADRNFIVYPNPNTGTFTLNLQQNSAEASIYVTDLFGKVVFEKQQNTETNLTIDLSDFSKGIYLIRVVDLNGNTEVKKVVVQ